jgi:vacuolar-type H+-ATPase subunit H
MSGIESVKIIVDAEKEAARIVEQAHIRASEIRKGLDSVIQAQRDEMLRNARKEATALVHEAEQKGKAEAAAYEKEAENSIRQSLNRASARKEQAVRKVIGTVLGSKL